MGQGLEKLVKIITEDGICNYPKMIHVEKEFGPTLIDDMTIFSNGIS